MLKATQKDISDKKNTLGQFFTPDETISKTMSNIDLSSIDTIIEPSYGSGNFLNYFLKNYKQKEIIGIELDEEYYREIKGVDTYNSNFYDFDLNLKNKSVAFVGNPPYRTPAYSLSTHPKFVKDLMSKYEITGMKEEAVIFFVHTFDLLKQNNVKDFQIHYILPKVIFQSQSNSYLSFLKFLEDNLNLYMVQDVPSTFVGVDTDLVMVSYKNGKQQENIKYNNKEIKIGSFYGQTEEYWDYRKVFKKTYLGSVPAESIFLSIKGESKDNFKKRLTKIFTNPVTIDSLKKDMLYNNQYHLKVLNGNNKTAIEAKWKVILKYVQEIKSKNLITKEDLKNDDNYKQIQHRKETRTYFRLEELKKVSFVYILNSNPCKSFYFTSNPSKTSTDYFGFCDYDVNRNSSPGSMRTVPVKDIEDNLTQEFKDYWDKQTNNLPYEKIFDYMLHISNSSWYKDFKNKYYRIYFGVPKKFDKSFLK